MFDQVTATETAADNGTITDSRQVNPVLPRQDGPVEKLKGEALTAMVTRFLANGATQTQIARCAGWVWEGGRTDVQGMWVEFGKATAGVQVGSARKGKTPTFETGVMKHGQILVGAAYAKQAGWSAGERVVIEVDPKEGTITLSRKQ